MGDAFECGLKCGLRDNGCSFVRTAKGSHELWYSPIVERHVVVPTGIYSRHTANAILKQAGVGKVF